MGFVELAGVKDDSEEYPMNIELTEQQRQLAREGQPIDVVDSQTNEAYVLMARQRFEQLHPPPPQDPIPPIPEGIRLSQEAFRRDLPQLLTRKRLLGQWVVYHRDERIGISRDGESLIRKSVERGL